MEENNIENFSKKKIEETPEGQSEVGVIKSKKNKLALIFIGLIVLVLGLILIINNQKQEVDTQLIIEPRELTIDMNNSVQVRVYLQGADVESREDITNQVEWYTNDPDLFVVGNDSVKGQVIAKDKEGKGFITLIYGEQTETVFVIVKRPQLEVECVSRVMAEDYKVEYKNTAKVGETIQWVAMYNEIGAPNYSYEWTGTDDLISDVAIAEKVYKTVGVKEAKFLTEDTAGSTANATCSITITK